MNSEIGYMNKLKDKLSQINKEFVDLIGSSSTDVRIEPTVNSLEELSSRLVRLKKLLVSEMNNPCVNNNDPINELCSIAYINVGKLNRQIEISLSNIGEEIFNLNTGKSEIKELHTQSIHNVIKRTFGDIFESVSAFIDYTLNKIKRDKIERGILDKDGKSKINPKDFFH